MDFFLTFLTFLYDSSWVPEMNMLPMIDLTFMTFPSEKCSPPPSQQE